LALSIPHTTRSIYTYLNKSYLNSCLFFLTDPANIIKISQTLQNKISSGYDDIPVNIMKSTINYIAELFSAIINSSLQNGIFPNPLKIARVSPIFKSGKSDQFINYRPISVLPSFSKISEKVIFNKLLQYLEKNNILSKNQYVFRKNHSTFMVITDLFDKISGAIDENHNALGIFY